MFSQLLSTKSLDEKFSLKLDHQRKQNINNQVMMQLTKQNELIKQELFTILLTLVTKG